MDVIKGIDFFNKTKTPLIGLIENMSYYQCNSCTKKQYIFGKGHLDKIQQYITNNNTLQIPISTDLSTVPLKRSKKLY